MVFWRTYLLEKYTKQVKYQEFVGLAFVWGLGIEFVSWNSCGSSSDLKKKFLYNLNSGLSPFWILSSHCIPRSVNS